MSNTWASIIWLILSFVIYSYQWQDYHIPLEESFPFALISGFIAFVLMALVSWALKKIKPLLDNIIAWQWLVIFCLIAFFLFGQCSNVVSSSQAPPVSSYPTITNAELTESALRSGCLDDALHNVPNEYSRCDSNQAKNEPLSISCPSGCTVPQPGCEIKGNISFETGEKIYHLPGQEYYSNTTIDPALGERWFCTEQDAVVNGWRKSRK